jgi:nitroreductase
MAKVASEKPFSVVVKERRSTPSFEDVPIHAADLEKIVRTGLEAPSGYNLQPWRFIVVRDPEQKKKLREAAFGQYNLGMEEASAIVVACGDPNGWKEGDLEEVLRIGREHGYDDEVQRDNFRNAVTSFLGSSAGEVSGAKPTFDLWVNRETMIAFTTMMWAAESLGYDTAPMEDFVEYKVKDVLKIPSHVRVVSMLAIGRLKGDDGVYSGRLDPTRTVFGEAWEQQIEF